MLPAKYGAEVHGCSQTVANNNNGINQVGILGTILPIIHLWADNWIDCVKLKPELKPYKHNIQFLNLQILHKNGSILTVWMSPKLNI